MLNENGHNGLENVIKGWSLQCADEGSESSVRPFASHVLFRAVVLADEGNAESARGQQSDVGERRMSLIYEGDAVAEADSRARERHVVENVGCVPNRRREGWSADNRGFGGDGKRNATVCH